MTTSWLRKILLPSSDLETLSLIGLANAYWRLIAVTSIAGGIIGIAAALMIRPIYRADARIVAVSDDAAASRVLSSGITDLAALAGVNLSAGQSSQENIAYLQSNSLLIGYINEHSALPDLFEEAWDSGRQTWIRSEPGELPSIGRALKLLHEGILFIDVDKKTGVITVAVRHHRPETAARWANGLVVDANRNLRKRDIEESTRAIEFLRSEVEDSNQPIELKQALYRLIEQQMKRRALAASREDYAFRFIDSARTPEQWEKVAPVRRAMTLIAAALGGILGVAIVLLVRRSQALARS